MRWRTALVATFLTAAIALPSARADTAFSETVEADVSTRSVSITSGFSGTEIIVFGTVENSLQPSAEAGTYDIVVVVEGTPLPAIVRKKSRIGGLWVNTESVRFASFPSYYAIASTRPLDEITDTATLNANEIGFSHVRMVPSGRAYMNDPNPDAAPELHKAIVRLKERDKLYVTSNYGVVFIGRSLFRAAITLPPNVPVGPLTSRVYLFKSGKLLSKFESKVNLQRAGIERFLYEAAFERPVLYAVTTIAFALFAGLAAAFAANRFMSR
jgi:uncharacterized protein (TIGR02186 family)